ncbi:hypothetical protein [Brevibacillus sp. VP]|uniref:hypothetical protein n=1 Tax=unclassified Brevibacillus TaxID=2684853 RepID=UPI000E2F46EC|nr:hypothetical protein [Brevibacillus sp. VP]RFB38754.1 hypothetical protein DZB91_02915 [Brevibacillus sp. VP]
MEKETKADMILSGNAVFTFLEDEPKPASIVIVASRIVAVGSPQEMKAFIGPETKIYQFDDQLIIGNSSFFELFMKEKHKGRT